MGKKKKGGGAEKTAAKTEAKADKRLKKSLADAGEEDIEKMIAAIEEKNNKLGTVSQKRCEPPSARGSTSLVANPEKDELFLFGGEFYNGKLTFVYGDLFSYNIQKTEWSLLKCPRPPPPRSAHQMVALTSGRGELWLFGGEFTSPSQNQFYHYKDLWCFHLKERCWEKLESTGGPTGRSGHRMAEAHRHLLVFGGFHDNGRSCRYYNDAFLYDTVNRQWHLVSIPGAAKPPARSACQLIALPESNSFFISGGYSRQGEPERGTVHTDMWLLQPVDKKAEFSPTMQFRWQQIKSGGVKPEPRTGSPMIKVAPGRCVMYGGVVDQETEEDVSGRFLNDAFVLDTGKWRWFPLDLRRPLPVMEIEDGIEPEEVVEETTFDDGIFKVTVASGGAAGGDAGEPISTEPEPFSPCPRMNAALAVKGQKLYLFGGCFERGDQEVTLADLYVINHTRWHEWQTLVEDSSALLRWEGEEESEDSDEGESDDEEGSSGEEEGEGTSGVSMETS